MTLTASSITAVDLRPHIAEALQAGRPVVALESSLLAHGLPWPRNLETGLAAEEAVRQGSAVPATIAVISGRPTFGLTDSELRQLAETDNVMKASSKDLAAACVFKRTAATTVAATMFLAHRVGIRFMATGGIGGVHRDHETSGDVSADLFELARTPVAVVCAGVKMFLDIGRTLEMLESFSVPVIGYATEDFPGFYTRGTGNPVDVHVDRAEEAAVMAVTHWALGGAGLIIAQPIAAQHALAQEELSAAIDAALAGVRQSGITGARISPFVLAELSRITAGRTLAANHELVVANAHLAAVIAGCEVRHRALAL
jgi:pseudouridine-5'-phosphate glycosidase